MEGADPVAVEAAFLPKKFKPILKTTMKHQRVGYNESFVNIEPENLK